MPHPTSSTIRVDPRFLTNLANRLDKTAGDLRSNSNHGGCSLSSAPPVQSAFQSLGERWDFNREKLAKQLDSLAAGFRKARDDFVTTDSELASLVDGETSRNV